MFRAGNILDKKFLTIGGCGARLRNTRGVKKSRSVNGVRLGSCGGKKYDCGARSLSASGRNVSGDRGRRLSAEREKKKLKDGATPCTKRLQ
jgi:hypothetical protein